MARKPLPKDYITRELTLLQKTDAAVLLRDRDTWRKGWLPKSQAIRAERMDPQPVPMAGWGDYKVTAQRYVFERAGLL